MTTLPPTTEPLAPGIYRDVPFADYLAIDAVSNTSIGLMEKSPAHYKARVELERTKPLVLGSMIHCGRLEPAALALRYAVCPDYHLDVLNCTDKGLPSQSKNTRWCKERVDEFMSNHGDKEVVSQEWYDEMGTIVAALCRDEQANRLFNDDGDVELTMIWRDPETGLLCKGRIDKVCRSIAAFVDLKSVADLAAFDRTIARYGYHRQSSFYQWGYEQLTGETLTPWISAVEKSAPHCVMSAPLCEEALDRGRERWRAALNRVAECTAANHWPGPKSPSAWRVPEWELNAGEGVELDFGSEVVEAV
jgi:exodeoxyribonuclease VIII